MAREGNDQETPGIRESEIEAPELLARAGRSGALVGDFAGRRRKDGTSVPESGPISDSDLPATQSKPVQDRAAVSSKLGVAHGHAETMP